MVNEVAVGVIGYGHAGAVFHAPLIQAEKRLRLSAVATSRPVELPGVRRVGSPAELFADPGIDLIVIASPNETHHALALAALDAGKHVVVDKPLANSAREAAELIARAAARGRTLSVFQNRRWDGDFLEVRKLIEEGTLGLVSHYESHFDRFRPTPKPGWREEAKPGSGLLYDLGSHLIDQALVLFGMPEEVSAEIEIQRPGVLVDDYFRLVLRWGARRAVLGASMLARDPRPRFEVRGSARSFVTHGLDPQEEALKAGVRPGGPGWSGAYPEYYARLAACLLDGGPIPVEADDARRALTVLEAARLSAAEKKPVAL
jgi:scyllo-inositol 2-dehydrogenase (NADP+)